MCSRSTRPTRSPAPPSSRRAPCAAGSGAGRRSPAGAGDGSSVDLRLMSAVPTAEERAAVDRVLGPPETGWTGGERAIELEGHMARGGREARERRHLLLPPPHPPQAP